MNGKAKEAFEKWFEKEYRTFTTSYAENVDKINNHIIVEWLDSVGILIFLKRKTVGHRDFEFDYWYFIITNIQGVHLNNFLESKHHVIVDDRNEATEAAIKKAVEIYNARFS
ncbi:hypothetical protein CMU98_03055 [Elizabethkingia anophelis]|nr:hypothetical protein [Elizabethkingia anophelis]